MLSADPVNNFQLPPCLHPPSPNPQLFLGGKKTSEKGAGAMRQRHPHSRTGKRFSAQVSRSDSLSPEASRLLVRGSVPVTPRLKL